MKINFFTLVLNININYQHFLYYWALKKNLFDKMTLLN